MSFRQKIGRNGAQDTHLCPSPLRLLSSPAVPLVVLFLLAYSLILPVSALSHLSQEPVPIGEAAQEPLGMTNPVQGPLKGGAFVHNNTLPPKEDKVFPLFNNRGKTAIVTGAGAGIGLAVAHALAESGANVAIWYHGNKDAIDRAYDIEKEYDVKCKAYQVNVQDQKAVKAAVDEIVDEFNGRLDIMVANAGIPWTQGSFLDGDVSQYRKVMSVDMDGVYYCAHAAGLHWRRQKHEGTSTHGEKLENFSYGSFIATASMSGHIVNIPQFQAAYNAAKAGVVHFVKSIAVEMVQFARANSISPGYIATELSNFIPAETKAIWNDKIPMGRPGQVRELKGAYLYLASDISSYTTGTDITVDGGYSLP